MDGVRKTVEQQSSDGWAGSNPSTQPALQAGKHVRAGGRHGVAKTPAHNFVARSDYLENARSQAGRPDGSTALKDAGRGRSVTKPPMCSLMGVGENPRAFGGKKTGRQAAAGTEWTTGPVGLAGAAYPLDANRGEAAPHTWDSQ